MPPEGPDYYGLYNRLLLKLNEERVTAADRKMKAAEQSCRKQRRHRKGPWNKIRMKRELHCWRILDMVFLHDPCILEHNKLAVNMVLLVTVYTISQKRRRSTL